jgi:hypothetical protein
MPSLPKPQKPPPNIPTPDQTATRPFPSRLCRKIECFGVRLKHRPAISARNQNPPPSNLSGISPVQNVGVVPGPYPGGYPYPPLYILPIFAYTGKMTRSSFSLRQPFHKPGQPATESAS